MPTTGERPHHGTSRRAGCPSEEGDRHRDQRVHAGRQVEGEAEERHPEKGEHVSRALDPVAHPILRQAGACRAPPRDQLERVRRQAAAVVARLKAERGPQRPGVRRGRALEPRREAHAAGVEAKRPVAAEGELALDGLGVDDRARAHAVGRHDGERRRHQEVVARVVGVHVPPRRDRDLHHRLSLAGGKRARDHLVGRPGIRREQHEDGQQARRDRSTQRRGPQRSGSTRAGRGSAAGRAADDSPPAVSGTHSTISRP